MKKKFYFIFPLIILSVILFWGCINETKANSSNKGIDKTKNQITLEQIKQSYVKTDEKILNTQEYKNYILVESQLPTLANHFTLYNLKTGSKNILPSGVDYIDSAKIINENNIILYSKGTNSESVAQIFPYEIDCTRVTENNNSEGGFIPIYKKIKFPIEKQISLKGKKKEEITDLRVTVNGLQVSFAPQDSKDVTFYADYIDIPTMDIFFDKTTKELSLKFQDTKIVQSLSNANITSIGNTFMKLLNIKEDGTSTILTIKLNKEAKYYTGKKARIYGIKNNIPYIDIQFAANNTD